MIRYYILNEFNEPVLEPSVLAWADWFENADRRIAFARSGDTDISCVFLGLDHGPGGDHPPQIYEVMTFHKDGLGYCERFESRSQAMMAFDQRLSDLEDH